MRMTQDSETPPPLADTAADGASVRGTIATIGLLVAFVVGGTTVGLAIALTAGGGTLGPWRSGSWRCP
jgi:hypothetical protein